MNDYASLQLRVTLFERSVCKRIDNVKNADKTFPKWSRLDTSNSIPAVFPPAYANSIFNVNIDTVRETWDLYKELRFKVGDDAFKPFEGIRFNLTQSAPKFLADKLSIDDFFITLRTERAFIGQVYCQTDSIRTPEAYKEILKLTDIKVIFKIMLN